MSMYMGNALRVLVGASTATAREGGTRFGPLPICDAMSIRAGCRRARLLAALVDDTDMRIVILDELTAIVEEVHVYHRFW